MTNLTALVKLYNLLDVYIEVEDEQIEKSINNWTVSEHSFHSGKKEAFKRVQDEIDEILNMY